MSVVVLAAESWWTGFIGWIFRGMVRFFCWLVLWFIDLGTEVIGEVLGWMPPIDPGWWQVFTYWCAQINAWFPADLVVSCIVAYVSCAFNLAAYRWFRAFIPF